ncbi:MAG TPA: FKBP-type peptidyl-prolyl cis-trans isomerase [Saprospiraceae bacterium]|nr:FKBP-type peptidyl-prolyl cis-trans isomerase [Saprospiraceae bacterium]
MRLSFLLSICVSVMLFTACKKETGTFKTSNNFEYIIHTKGTGPKVKVGEYVLFTYKILGDGVVKQESLDPSEPGVLKVEDAAAAKTQKNFFNEVVINAQVGDSITLNIPADSLGNPMLAQQGIKVMTYTMKIQKILDEAGYTAFTAEKEEAMKAKTAERMKMLPEVTTMVEGFIAEKKAGTLTAETLPSGLMIKKVAEGTGVKGEKDKVATVEYYGALENGTSFDNSFQRPDAFSFPIGQQQVIPGWDEALTQLKVGDKAIVYIPSELAYGPADQGSIPANSNLIFYIEVKDIK